MRNPDVANYFNPELLCERLQVWEEFLFSEHHLMVCVCVCLGERERERERERVCMYTCC